MQLYEIMAQAVSAVLRGFDPLRPFPFVTVHRITRRVNRPGRLEIPMLSDDDVRKIARLAHLTLSDQEVEQYRQQLSSILDYIRALEKIDVSKVEAMSHVHGVTNVMRDDQVDPRPLDTMEAMKNAPDHSGRFFRVPLIVE